MSDLIRSGNAGRCALALLVMSGLLALCFAQETAPPPPTKDEAPVKAAVVPPEEPPAAPSAPAAAPGSTNVAPASAAPQTPAPQPPAPQTAAPSPAPVQNGAKGKSSKKNKNSTFNSTFSGGGEVTGRGVQKKPYEIGPEDVLYVNVLHQPDVSSTLEVRPDGFISVRFAGEVKAAGLTPLQLSDVIAEKLTVYFNHPEVVIQIVRINSKKYYVAGEVRRPGSYPLTSPKTIYEALIEAGGLAEFAKKSKIYVQRGSDQFKFNYADVTKGKNLQQNILLENGDVIQVP